MTNKVRAMGRYTDLVDLLNAEIGHEQTRNDVCTDDCVACRILALWPRDHEFGGSDPETRRIQREMVEATEHGGGYNGEGPYVVDMTFTYAPVGEEDDGCPLPDHNLHSNPDCVMVPSVERDVL